MADVIVEGNNLMVASQLQMTSGSVNAYKLSFQFSEEWEELDKVAMFRTDKSITLFTDLDEENECVVPWEILLSYDVNILIEVCGVKDGVIVLPSVWAQLGPVKRGLTSTTVMPSSGTGSGGQGGGTLDHRLLTNRDADFQHTINSISGLNDVIKTIPPPTLALTNNEIDNLLKG